MGSNDDPRAYARRSRRFSNIWNDPNASEDAKMAASDSLNGAWAELGYLGRERVKMLPLGGLDPLDDRSVVRAGQALELARAPFRSNPYNATTADQSRAAQLALASQLQSTGTANQLGALQRTRGLSQNSQQALMAAAGGPSRMALVQANQAGGGMARDAAGAGLASLMRGQAGAGSTLGALRGADLRSAGNQQSAGLSSLGLDFANRQGFAGLGARTSAERDATLLELQKIDDKARSTAAGNKKQANADTWDALDKIPILSYLWG